MKYFGLTSEGAVASRTNEATGKPHGKDVLDDQHTDTSERSQRAIGGSSRQYAVASKEGSVQNWRH